MTRDRVRPGDSAWRPTLAGWLIIALFFGGFGVWAATAPLNGAVVASAVVKVEGNRKSVQHLDGGSVKELHVSEGNHVAAGDLLIVLDDTQAKAEYEVLSRQFVVLRATEVRLTAEAASQTELALPSELAGWTTDPHAAGIWLGQVRQFETRRDALTGQAKVIAEKINQLRSQIEGAEAQVKAYTEQALSVRSETESVAPLVDKMLLPRARLLQLQRSASGLDGQIADARANIAKHRQAIAEQELQIAQLGNDRMADITRELREVHARMAEVLPKRIAAQAMLGRMEIRAPYAGRVVGLSVFSVGGVIQRAEKVLDIVPDDDSLTVEALVAPEDIADLRPGMPAELRLTAYKQHVVPMIRGRVVQVSADRLTDARTNGSFFVASIRPEPAELAKLADVRLVPGMPATVMVPTEARTALDYIAGPLLASFNQAFRQK